MDEDILKENYKYMNGIIRYAFRRDDAKAKVESALKEVRQSWSNLQVGGVEPDRHYKLVLWIRMKGEYD